MIEVDASINREGVYRIRTRVFADRQRPEIVPPNMGQGVRVFVKTMSLPWNRLPSSPLPHTAFLMFHRINECPASRDGRHNAKMTTMISYLIIG